MKALVTGGAGFIGSNLCRALVENGWDVIVLDDFSAGFRENLLETLNSARSNHAELLVGDCTKSEDVRKALEGVEVVFHLAANPEVRIEFNSPANCFRQNVYATHVLLEAFRSSSAHTIIFTSTSAIYGEASVLPTPEYYAPLEPISIYGASKLAGEVLVTSYCRAFGKRGIILRLANVVGPKSNHGVVHDFVSKLRQNPRQLEVLGDGTQAKSYLYVDDCVDALLRACRSSQNDVEIFNVGSEDLIDVKRVAMIVSEEMRLNDVSLEFVLGALDGRGWVGDVKNMLLDITRIKTTGWNPRYTSEQAIRLATRSVVLPTYVPTLEQMSIDIGRS